jgi:hypothetical protein
MGSQAVPIAGTEYRLRTITGMKPDPQHQAPTPRQESSHPNPHGSRSYFPETDSWGPVQNFLYLNPLRAISTSIPLRGMELTQALAPRLNTGVPSTRSRPTYGVVVMPGHST